MLIVNDSTILIHHWDADGLCSAALILEQINKDVKTWTPPLGTFYLTDEAITMAQSYDNVIICDIAFPILNIKEISKKSNVFIIDHHHQNSIDGVEHINPLSDGADDDVYPSNTWVIKEYLSLPVSLKIILGLVGDREHKIMENPHFNKIIQHYLKNEDIEFSDLLELVYRIDSNYKVGERETVMKIPHILKEYNTRKDILSNDKWEKNLQKLEDKLEKVLLESPNMIDGIQVKMLDTSYAIISQVTRRLVWDSGKDAIVVNTGFFEEKDQFYSRSNTVDMHKLIELAKQYGYNAGGKKDVIGAIIPKTETEKFLVEAIEYLKKNR